MGTRDLLPFREKTEVFLVTKSGQVVAQDHKKYIMFAGGGCDPGESILTTARREILEEVGAKVSGLKHLTTVDWIWFPEWANNPKRKQRYSEFQGERVHNIVGYADSFGKSTSTEEDDWKGSKTMSIKRCIDLVRKYGKSDHPNTYAYRLAQILTLQYIALMAKCHKL